MRTRTKKAFRTNKDLVNKLTDDPVSAMRAFTKGRFYHFFRYFWDTYSQDALVENWHIEFLCDELEKIARNVSAGVEREYDLIVNIPPGTSKTAITSVFFPIWCWVNWHWMRFITTSYAASLSLESAEYSREIIRSNKFKQLFPEIEIKQDKDTKSNFRVVKKEFLSKGRAPRLHIGGNRLSSSITGIATGFHGHINIWDDPLDPRRAASDAELLKAIHFFDNVLPFRKANKSTTVTVGIMQRLSKQDPTEHLLDTRNDIKHICLPGEINTLRYKEKVNPPELQKKYIDGLLDPKRLNRKVLESYENLGQFTYGSQIGQDPVPLGGGMFKVDYIGLLDRPPAENEIRRSIRYWDKAGTAGGDGAYTVGVKMYELIDGRWVIVDVRRGRWGTAERERIIKQTAEADAMAMRRTPTTIYIEQEPGSGGKESAENTIRNLAGHAVYADRPTGDKVYRADPFSVQVNNGNVFMVKADWNKEYLEELEFFPNSLQKDQVDASSGAFAKIVKKKQVKVLI